MTIASQYNALLPMGALMSEDRNRLIVLGNNIERIRKNKNMTQDDLASKVGVSRSTIARIEKGEDTVALGTLYKISEALETTLSSLIGEKKESSQVSKDVTATLKAIENEQKELYKMLLELRGYVDGLFKNRR